VDHDATSVGNHNPSFGFKGEVIKFLRNGGTIITYLRSAISQKNVSLKVCLEFVRSLLVILLHHGEYRGGGGWRQQGRYIKSKLQKTVPFIAVESLDVASKPTHPIRCLDTPERVAWIMFACLGFKRALQKFRKVGIA
jgi:hypothetical protein